MTIGECYQAIGGDYKDVSTRLPSEKMIIKFVGKFLDDPSFQQLLEQMKTGNREEAFRAAHTLKGVSANLGFGRLLASVSQLTEELREENENISENAYDLFHTVEKDYQETIAAIRTFIGEVA